jgi:hypothetical protein
MTEQQYPKGWATLATDFDPQKHLMQIKGKLYMTVQNRMIWFLRDQRAMIAAGIATTSYTIQTDLVEHDRDGGWAHFKTYVRDVLGNEATMYGSESVRDFPDYIEKASTKSLGRALLLLGYATAYADEFDEGERVVDSPVQRPQATQRPQTPAPQRPAVVPQAARPAAGTVQTTAESMATDRQITSIRKLCAALGRPEPEVATLTFQAARELLTSLSQAYSEARQAS